MTVEKIKYFIPKILNRLATEKNRLWKHCNVERVSMWGFSHFTDAIALKGHLKTMLGNFSVEMLTGISDDVRQSIIDSAEYALRHEFDLLGSGIVRIDPIDWHCDFKSQVRWEKKYYREIGRKNGADIKVPWELSRCQHLLWLGEAFLLTEDKRYAQEIVDEINGWIDGNPLMYSVNWTCSMDVAFRAVNWMFALCMIVGYEGFDDAFAKKVTHSLWQHAFFIRNNLEKQIPYSNNHYVSDIVGLLYLGTLFRHTKKGKRWLRFTLYEYFSEIRQQVLPSGIHYERSVSYHRLVTELLSYPVYMLKRVGEQVPTDILDRIQSMYAYIANYTKPNGFAPLIADNDDGRFVPFLKRDFRIHNYLNDTDSIENRFIACGDKVLFHSEQQQSKVYSDAGFAIMKNEDACLFVSNGGYSKCPKDSDVTIGTHTHNDLLSFDLNVCGHDIIVDPGTFLYTSAPASRNEFRSTKKHNTVVVDDEEQNGFVGPFVVRRNVYIGTLEECDGSVTGEYKTIQGGLSHRRTFTLADDSITIIDSIRRSGDNHHGNLYFHFAAGCSPRCDGRITRLEMSDCMITIDSSVYDIALQDDTISPSFGVLERTKTAVYSFEFSKEKTIKTVIRWIKTSSIK